MSKRACICTCYVHVYTTASHMIKNVIISLSRNMIHYVIQLKRAGTKNLKPGSQHSALQRESVLSSSRNLVPKIPDWQTPIHQPRTRTTLSRLIPSLPPPLVSQWVEPCHLWLPSAYWIVEQKVVSSQVERFPTRPSPSVLCQIIPTFLGAGITTISVVVPSDATYRPTGLIYTVTPQRQLFSPFSAFFRLYLVSRDSRSSIYIHTTCVSLTLSISLSLNLITLSPWSSTSQFAHAHCLHPCLSSITEKLCAIFDGIPNALIIHMPSVFHLAIVTQLYNDPKINVCMWLFSVL